MNTIKARVLLAALWIALSKVLFDVANEISFVCTVRSHLVPSVIQKGFLWSARYPAATNQGSSILISEN